MLNFIYCIAGDVGGTSCIMYMQIHWWFVAQCVCVKIFILKVELIGKNTTVAKTCSKYEFLSSLIPSPVNSLRATV